MAEKKVNLGEMGVEAVEICPGLVIDNKAKIHTIRMMERRFKLPSEKFPTIDFTYIDNIISVIYFLAHQHDSSIIEEKVEELLERADLEKVSKHLGAAFGVKLKNSPKPSQGK